MYKLVIASQAQQELKKIPKRYKNTIRLYLRELRHDASIGKPLGRELTGKLSIKIEVYRIIYMVNEKSKRIYVSTTGHRGKVYK